MSPVYLFVVPLLGAFITLFNKKNRVILSLLVLVLDGIIILSVPLGTYTLGGFSPPYGIALEHDALSLSALLLIHATMVIIVLSMSENDSKFIGVLLTLLAGVNGMLLTGDLFNLFVMMEIVAITSVILTLSNRDSVATFHYLIMASIGGVLFLIGTVMLYSLAGHVQITGMYDALSGLKSDTVLLPLALIVTGISVELKIIPGASWVKGIYKKATTVSGLIFVGVLVPTFGFVTLKLMSHVVVIDGYMYTLLMVASLSTLVLGEFAAYKQETIRGMLAYSSIAQAGLVLLLLTSGLTHAVVMLIFNVSIAKTVLMFIATKLKTVYGSDDLKHISGVFRNHKRLGVLYTLASFSVMGMPLFYGFSVKLNLLKGLFINQDPWVPAVVLLVTIIELAYMMRFVLALWSSASEGEYAIDAPVAHGAIKSHISEWGVVVLVAFLLVIGVLPGLVDELIGYESTGLILDYSTVSIDGGAK